MRQVALAIIVILMLAANVMGQTASPMATPHPHYKSPTAAHHHYDRRRPHKGATEQQKQMLEHPQSKPD